MSLKSPIIYAAVYRNFAHAPEESKNLASQGMKSVAFPLRDGLVKIHGAARLLSVRVIKVRSLVSSAVIRLVYVPPWL